MEEIRREASRLHRAAGVVAGLLLASAAFAQPPQQDSEARPRNETTEASLSEGHERAPASRPPGADIRPAPGRPEIGLALSGGGARGGAHIGVLKALEELRVPVDYIAGTSIGAIVGGFYAAGRTVEELETLIETIDWDTAFLNITPRQLRSFRRKRDDDSFLVKHRPGLNSGELELPIGLVQGQVIELIIAESTLPAWTIDDFDELPIPFRAVAADIATGEPVVLDSGSLALAIRASMALPAALTPVEIDDQLLVDGGVAMNLPVEVARDMGSDVVIAVDISSSLLTRETLNSVLDVTSQLTNLLTRQGVESQRELLTERDILLSPEFQQELTSADFERMPEAVVSGYEAVMLHRDELEPLMLSPEEYSRYLASRTEPALHDLPILDFVRLDNQSVIADSILETRLRDVVVGEPLTIDTLEAAVNQVYGLELFQNVRYQVVTEGEQTGLEVQVVPRSWGPNYLQLGMSFSSSEDRDALFGLAASYLRTAINDRGGEWRATFIIGDEPGFTVDYYQPLGPKGLFFIEPIVSFQSNQFNVFDGEDLTGEARLREATLEFSFGRELLNWGEVRAGVRRTAGETELRVGETTAIPAPDYHRGEYFTRFTIDTLDSVAFPRTGLLASAEWRGSSPGLGADSNYDQLLLSAAHAKTWGRHTLLSTARYDVTISGQAPLNRSFRLGGFLDLSGLSHNQLTGQHAARLGLSYYRRIGDLALFPAFAGVSIELGNAWTDRSGISIDDTTLGASMWAGVDTPVGPIYVGYGRAEEGIDAYYVFLGRAF